MHDNPLLAGEGLPPFDRIEPRHVIPGIREVLSEARTRLEAAERDVEPTWEATVAALDEIERPFEYAWGPVQHLHGVKNSPELRQAYQTVLDEIVAFGLRMRQSRPIYQALKELKENVRSASLDEARRRIIEKKVQDAELAGIGLEGAERERFNEIVRELSQLSTEFSNHVLDATKSWSLVLTDKADVEGLPPSLLRLAAQSYNENQESGVRSQESGVHRASAEGGPWRFTLEATMVVPFLQHCRQRDLREQVYRAYVTRASAGEADNSELIVRILELRREQARLIGYGTYAEAGLTRKMAGTVAAVEEMFQTLRDASWPHAVRDLGELRDLAIRPHPGQSSIDDRQSTIRHWDVAFYAERLREERFGFTDEQLRPYFPLERVLEGLFRLAERLFGIRTERADGQAPVWHKDVRYFQVFDAECNPGPADTEKRERSSEANDSDPRPPLTAHRSPLTSSPIAAFYLDPYSRPENKRGGAWMDECLTRRRIADRLQIPVAHLVCNATPPTGEVPSLMTFREVETLFHEFGHGLQHMLTRVDYPDAAGINGIEWDAVELPSQFMENWCYHRPTLIGLSSHYQTGEPLPDGLFEKLRRARTFRAGSDMLRQLQFGMIDMELHHRWAPDGGETPFETARRIAEATSVLPPLPEDRSLCAFQHIFSGGYAAGYYSYKWAEILSADAFAAFEEAGLDDEAAISRIGRKFRETVLASGGGRHPMEVFTAFRGRPPSPHALLRQYGLAPE